MKKLVLLIPALVLVLAACAPSQGAVQTAIANTQTQEALMHPTDTPTFTITPSPTRTATSTQSPTLTHTVTDTPTETPTPLPPETLTAISLGETQTAAAQATSEQKTLTADSQYKTQTVAAQATGAQRTRTVAQATVMASYVDIDYRELVNYADSHIGQKVRVRIRIFNIVGRDELQGYISGTYEAIYVATRSSFSGIYENDYITVYGTVGGSYCFENSMGATICQPLLADAFFTKP